jgi:hypothetical protein
MCEIFETLDKPKAVTSMLEEERILDARIFT